ncbi:MAG: phosphate ABC transporter permease subunit PstC [Gemmatimonadaceae bacterium]|jgi:phosphate transport system permease protein|nr:phosphate ABC transporter permease subunit PstC [Gemmatimonadaceae bacterium]
MSTARLRSSDRLFHVLTALAASAVPVLLLVITGIVAYAAWPALRDHGLTLFTGTEWDVPRQRFGALPAIVGTLLTSAMALAIAAPIGVSVAIFVNEMAPRRIGTIVGVLVDLLAAIPSVVYGLWGIFVLLPWLRETVMPLLRDQLGLGAFSLFSGPAYGPSLLAATLVLAIMVLPYIAAVGREVLAAVPRAQREAALALGATRWEMIRDAVLPAARSGLVGGVMLGLGRALGETMAVTMVIGNRNALPDSLFAPAYSMAALLANEFNEATNDAHVSALMAVAGALLVIALLVNALARLLVGSVTRRSGAPVTG